MISSQLFRTMALSFHGSEEMPHFEKTSFRVKKKIFATLDEKNKKAVVKLSVVDQSAFCAFDPTIIYPVPRGWGKQGWTVIDLTLVTKTTLKDVLTTAYKTVTAKTKK
ncbi:MAG: MmcQ/YjbR family DNA-binding protein [Bacteroidota bacterium]